MGTYTWSKAKNLGNDFGSQPADITNADYEIDYGLTPNDVRHRVTRRSSTSCRGPPVLERLPVQHRQALQRARRPRRDPQRRRAIDPATGQMFERNSFTGPNYLSWDARLSKMFRFGGSKYLEVLFEMFNITNHVNFADDPRSGFNTLHLGNFGTPTQIVPNSQRQAEFGVRFQF
jgi:hypothetical protein